MTCDQMDKYDLVGKTSLEITALN